MVIKKLTYLGFALGIAALSGCSDDVAIPDTLSGDGTKTPLTVTAVLDVNGDQAKTRAADKDFANGDQLVAYLRHVTWNGKATGERTSVVADKAPVLVTFTCTGSENWPKTVEDILPFVADTVCTNTGVGTEANTKQASGLTATPALYWDDFSANDPINDGAANSTNLRDPGHYLQSFYGYCYNGGESTNIKTALVEPTGELGWQVATDQTSGFKTSDLLWSAEQTPVSYLHNATHDADHNGLILPFTHAMSMVTINITAGEGFDADYAFTGTEVQLTDVRTSCKATAPTVSLDCKGCTKGNVTMMPGKETGTRAFQCVIVPSILTVGNTLATITNMDGNLYTIQVTSNIIKGWKTKLKETDEEVNNGTAQARPQHAEENPYIPGGKGHQMMSGVNYVLNVTLHKTEATVEATILDWNTVTAEGEGIIHFTNDIDKKGEIDNALKANGFDVYKSTDADNFGTKATTMRWNKGTQTWRYNPVIYWQGNAKDEYFRALANVNYDDPGSQVNESLLTENGRDPLWGTTKAHSGTDADGQTYNYGEGDPLHPRTGDVPLIFYHAMAKITFNLKDINAGSSDPSAKLDLSQATIQLTNLATGGTINLKDGSVTTNAEADKTFSEDEGATPKRMGYYAANENNVETHYDATKTIKEYTIIPQNIGNDAMLIITLANGTTYQAKLNTCTTPNGSTTKPVDKWEKGNHYVYDITLTKDQITFCAQIKEWVEIKASGTIMPEW